MSPHEIIRECRARGITLELIGDRLRCRAPVGVMTPELKQVLTDQKAGIMLIIAAKALSAPTPEVADRSQVIAVKVWSDVLGEAVWVVTDDLPQEEWPTDAPVYTHEEVRILKQVGQNTVAWVHAVKVEVGSRILDARQRHDAGA